MKIECFRCRKPINSPDASNADYVLAADMVSEELRDILVAVQSTEGAKEALAEIAELEAMGLKADEELRERSRERLRTIVSSSNEALALPGLERVELERKSIPIQKTGVICPDCYEDTDFIIWGVHK